MLKNVLPKKNHSGFTLVEILVVIVIIAILAAIIFAAISKAKVASKKTIALSNLSQIGKALSLYNADHDLLYPYACSADDKFTTCGGEVQSALPLLDVVMANYTKSRAVWENPLDTGIPIQNMGSINEPIECQLPGTSPSMYAKYGSSFLYRKDLATDHVSEPFEFVAEDSGEVIDQSDFVILHDAYGNWLGGPEVPAKKVSSLYGDGHVRVANLTEVRKQGAFRSKK